MNARMKEHLLKNVVKGIAIMIRDNSAFHVFDCDEGGDYVFVMAVAPKGSIPEQYMTPSAPLQRANAEDTQSVSESPEEPQNKRSDA